jgi:hypothetical protein
MIGHRTTASALITSAASWAMVLAVAGSAKFHPPPYAFPEQNWIAKQDGVQVLVVRAEIVSQARIAEKSSSLHGPQGIFARLRIFCG